MRQQFEELLKERSVFVFLGAGGVGKTSTSILFALRLASMGRKVALLSIDPAKRLADALGITLGHELRRLDLPLPPSCGGSVAAAMLDQKAMFDHMVRKHAPTPNIAEKILANRLYLAAATNLTGPLEYMALAKLQELAEHSEYDCVLLDTPPDTHAVDFLARPNVLAGFMENKVMTWLIKPFALAGKWGFDKVFSMGEKLMGGVAKITGIGALRSFADFLLLMQEVIDGFHKSGEAVLRLLHSNQTAFALVTTATNNAVRSAKFLNQELLRLGYHLDCLIVNRIWQGALPSLSKDEQSYEQVTENEPIRRLEKVLAARLQGEAAILADLKEGSSDLSKNKVHFVKIAEQSGNLDQVNRLMALSLSLKSEV